MAARASVAIRLGTEGKATVKADLREIANDGDATANRWARSFERAGKDVEDAMRRQQLAAEKLAQITPTTPIQREVQAAASTSYTGSSARESAQFFAEQAAAQAQLEARTRALVASIDPAAAAQARFNREMAEARALVSAGAISLDQYVAKLGQERAALEQATAASRRNNVSVGQLRAGTQQLSFQIGDVAQQFALGTPPMVIFAQQGGQVVQAIQMMSGSSKGFIGFLAGPWGAVISGGVMVLGMLASKLFDNTERAKEAEKAMEKFQQRQSDIVNFIDQTTGALKEQNRVLVLNAMLTRQAQIAANEKSITESRIKMFQAAERGNRRVEGGYLNEFGVAGTNDPDVERVIKQAGGDVVKLTDGLAALAKRRPELNAIVQEVSGIGGAAVLAQRENERLRVELKALAGDTSALRQGDKAALDARAALASATTDVARAQARYTIAIREAEQAWEKSKKSAADDAKYIAARAAADRDLAKAQEGARSGRERLTAAQRAARTVEREAVKDAREYARDLQALIEKFDPAAAAARRYREQIELINRGAAPDRKGNRDITPEQEAMLRAGSDKEFRESQPGWQIAETASKAIRAEREQDQSAIDQRKRDLADSIAYAERELQLVAANDNVRERELATLRFIQDLKRDMPKLSEGETAALVEQHERLMDIADATAKASADWEQWRGFASNTLDQIFDPNNWEDWGDLGERILKDLAKEFIMLAALNPLKNMMFGSDLPTIGGFFDTIGSLFSGGIPGFGSIKFATGTYHAPGGVALVGENGPELVNLPRGSQVKGTSATRQAMAGMGGISLSIVTNIDATGAQPEAEAAIRQALAERDARLPGEIVNIVADVQQRLGAPLGLVA